MYKPIIRTMRAKIVVMSHLSDSKIEMFTNPEIAQKRIEFVKFLILKLNGDLTKDIEPDELWNKFINK